MQLGRSDSERLLLSLWALVSLVVLGLMLLHQSDDGRFLGRYSLTYAATLGTMLLLTLGAFAAAGLAWRGILQQLTLPHSPILGFGLVLVAVLYWYFMPGARSDLGPLLFLLYTTSLLVILSVMLVGEQSLSAQFSNALVVASILLVMLVALFFVGRVPPSVPWDESFILNWGYTMFSTGEPWISMLPNQPAERVASAVTIPYLVTGAWATLFGFSLEAARFSVLLLGWLGAPFVFLIGRRLYGVSAATLALIVYILLMLPHAYVRNDPFTATVIALALFFWFEARHRQRLWLYFLAGVSTALTLEATHFGARFIIIAGLFLTLDYALQIVRARRWLWNPPYWAFAAGGILFCVFYLYFHSYFWGVSLERFVEMARLSYEYEAGMGGSLQVTERLPVIVRSWWEDYLLRHPLELALLIAGILGALWRRLSSDCLLLVILGMTTALLWLMLPKHNVIYYVHHLPILVLWVGALVTRLGQAEFAVLNRRSSLVLVAIMALSIAQMQRQSNSTWNADSMIDLGYTLDKVLPAELEIVVGDMPYYHGLANRRFIASFAFDKDPSAPWRPLPDVVPQAILFSQGRDTIYPELWRIVDQQGMVLTGCWQLESMSNIWSYLYVLPEYAPDDLPQNCPEPRRPDRTTQP